MHMAARSRRTFPTATPASSDILAGYRNKIICGDALKIMRDMPDHSVDLVITSPPYNLKNSTGNGMKDGRGGKWERAALKNGYSHHNDCKIGRAHV